MRNPQDRSAFLLSRRRGGRSRMKRYVLKPGGRGTKYVCLTKWKARTHLTLSQYAQYMYETNVAKLPASWAESGPAEDEKSNGANHANGVNGHATTNGTANGSVSVLPKSFLDGKSVRTVYGLVPLKHALDWPIFASYDELTGCATWMGGRIPTFEEARSIYTYVNVIRKKEAAEKRLSRTVPAVNG